MISIGIDPGLTGAIAPICSRAGLLAIADLPVCKNGTESGSMRNWLDVAALSELLKQWGWQYRWGVEDVQVVIERPIPMPSLPAQTIACQFDTVGALRAVCQIKGWPVHMVNPNQWKKLFGLKRDKDESMACCKRLYPAAPVTLKKHHNRAEAVLIGHWLIRQVDG